MMGTRFVFVVYLSFPLSDDTYHGKIIHYLNLIESDLKVHMKKCKSIIGHGWKDVKVIDYKV